MPKTDGGSPRDLLGHVLLPIANKQDAEATATALEPYQPGAVTALHVVEKGEGVPDKTPVEQSEEVAKQSFAAVRSVFPDANDHTIYARDVVEAIFEAGRELEVTAVAYRPRPGNRLIKFLSGDQTLKLVTQSDRPVIALPEPINHR